VHAAYRAIDCNPCHDLGMHEMTPRTANFPYTLVGSRPDLLYVPGKRPLEVPGCFKFLQSVFACLVEGIEHLAIHIELELLGRGIADPHWLRTFVTRQFGQLEFGKTPFSRHTVHD